MTTLVYFASGSNKKNYKSLPFDKIYLIDNCFKKDRKDNIYTVGKITCVGMDCLESIAFLKKENVQIDYFVSLNEGLYEGGGSYAINSDMFLGYFMPLLKDEYIHIMNKSYYQGGYGVSMDLPYKKKVISEDDDRYLSPFIFSDADYQKHHAKVFEMTRINNTQNFNLNSNIKLTISHDSIWNHYDKLDLLILSIFPESRKTIFEKIPKVINIKETNYNEILNYCVKNKISKIGFTPWLKGKYNNFHEALKNYNAEYPKEITLFHLNKGDFSELKKITNIKI